MKKTSVPAPKKMMKSSMPASVGKGALPSGGPTTTGAEIGATGWKNGGAVKKMPTSMPRKGGC